MAVARLKPKASSPRFAPTLEVGAAGRDPGVGSRCSGRGTQPGPAGSRYRWRPAGCPRRECGRGKVGAHAVVGTLAAYSATKGSLRQALAGAKHPIFYLAIPPTNFEVVVEQLGKSGCSNGCASLSKNLSVAMGLLPGNSTASCSELLKKGPSSVWTIFLARVRCITWCTSVSGMQCSNPCGIATMSRVSRSRWRRTLESRAGRVL
jgi:hypothetical protein